MSVEKNAEFLRQVGAQAARKLKVQREGPGTIWRGLGMFGLVGWSVAIPTLAGAALGLWLDKRHPAAAHPWTLPLLVAGLVLGCANVWYWVAQEYAAMHEETGPDDE
jgi:ATP synthase protein I